MHRTYLKSSLASLIAVALLASCGTGGSGPLGAGGTSSAFREWVAQQHQAAQPTVTTGLPAFPVESGPRTPSAAGDSQTVLGNAFIQQRYGTVDGDALVIGPSGSPNGNEPSYGVYRFTGLTGKSLQTLTVNAIPGQLEMEYYVGLADFTTLHWHWLGPVSLPEFQYSFNDDGHRYISALGNMYLVVATHEANVARHESSTLTFGSAPPDDPTAPGAPTDLVASDGTFADGVGLTWQAGDGAQWYRVFRKAEPNSAGAAEWNFIGEAQNTEFFDANTVPDHVYYYKVNAARYGPDGQILYSGYSNIDSGYAHAQGSGGVPGTPTDLVASDGTFADHVDLTWNTSDGAEWYRVERYDDSGWHGIGEPQTNSYADTTATPGVSYAYRVQACRNGDQGQILSSDYSNIDTGYAGNQSNDGYSIAGVINDGYRAGTVVTLLGKGENPLTTQLGQGGTFLFDGLAPGPYVVYAYNPNVTFEPGFWGGQLSPNNNHVTLSFTGGPVSNALRTWGFVYKYAPNANGALQWQPVVGATVSDRLDGSQDSRSTTTGDLGYFAVFENPVGMNILTPTSAEFTFAPTQSSCEVNGQQVPAPQLFRAFPVP